MARNNGGGTNRLTRQIAGYFAIILIPLLIIAVLAYQSFWNKSRLDLSDRIRLSLQGSIQNVDNSISIAQHACISLFSDQRVRRHLRPISESTAEDRLEQIHIHQQISSLTNLTGGIAESMFIYLDNQHVFSDGLYSFFDYFTKICRYEAYDAAYWQQMRSERHFLTLLPATEMTRYPQATRRVVPIVYRGMIGKHDAISVMTLSVANIQATIRAGMITSDTLLMIQDAAGQTVFSELTEHEASKLSMDTAVIKQNENAYGVISAQSPMTAWKYTLLVPMAQIATLSSDFLWAILAMLAAFILASALGLYFTQRIARPIRQIYTALDSKDSNEPRNLDEISRRVSVVLSDYQEAHEEKLSMQQTFIEMSLFQLLSGREIADIGMLSRLLAKEYGFKHPVYQCAVLHISYDWSGKPLQDTERLNMQINLQSDLTAYISEVMPCCALEYRENEYVFIINCPSGEENKGYTLLERLLGQLRGNSRVASAHIGVTRVSSSLPALSEGFRQSVQMLLSMPGTTQWWIGYGDQITQASPIQYTLRDEMRLLSALRSGEWEKVRSRIHSLLEKSAAGSEQQRKSVIHDLFITAMRFLGERNETLPNRYLYQGLRADVDLPGGIEEKQALLLKLYEELLQLACQPAGDSDLTANIIAYVRQNYASDLYLERIAEEMGLSVKYISRVFKIKMQQNLSDYINFVRVEHIKELLMNTDMGISEIGASAGIHSRTSFLRIFRKLEGVTPSEYRELAWGTSGRAKPDEERNNHHADPQ